MAKIQLPNNWEPRDYQLPAWTYLEKGGRHAELIWHRRSGKDEICLNRAAVAAFERVANYWHMLPEYAQARKAIWDAVNPHTGKRRIDEAFPQEIRKTTRNQEMQIEFINGSTWQVVGSDRFDALVGSTPAGIVYSEWALANPSARTYLRPILAENNGWQIFITTPRGNNHARHTFEAAQKNPHAFAQRLSAYDTKVFTSEQLTYELEQAIQDFGEVIGRAKFEQEYLCSWDAAILGAVWGKEFADIESQGRLGNYPILDKPVFTSWDLGYKDQTAIFWWQIDNGRVRFIDHYDAFGADIDHYVSVIKSKGYKYANHWLPHDAKAKTLASGGKSIQEMLQSALGMSNIRIVPNLSLMDGIQATRKMLQAAVFDEKTIAGVEACKQYRYTWKDETRTFSVVPLHDWCFVGETNILTHYGKCRIMDLPYSGKVMTSCGWKQYTNPRITRKNAQLVEVVFLGGYSVKCTPDHLFKTDKGWISAEHLMKGLQIQSSWTLLRSILMGVCTVYGHLKNTFLGAAKSYIEMFGELLLGKYRQIATFITLTEIRQTTTLKTLNVYRPAFIYQKENEKKHQLVYKQEWPQLHGTNQKKADFGIADTPKDQKVGQNGKEKKNLVKIAEKLLTRLLEKEILKNIVPNLAKPLHIIAEFRSKKLKIEKVTVLNEMQDVWCLTVKDLEEFSLENWAIVHNCSHHADALRMAAIAWKEEAKPEQVKPPKFWHEATLEELWSQSTPKRNRI